MTNIFNPELLRLNRSLLEQRNKEAFTDAATASGGGGDPMAAAMGGGDPMAGAMGGGDPMAGAMPAMAPGDPAAGGGGDPMMEQRLAALEAQLAGGGGAGGGMGGAEPIKPKIDVNVEIMQMKKLLARIADHMKIPIPASEMVATSDDLTQMGMQDQAAGAGAPPPSPIQPPDPIAGAAPMPAGGGGEKMSSNNGRAVPQTTQRLRSMSSRASAMATLLRAHAR